MTRCRGSQYVAGVRRISSRSGSQRLRWPRSYATVALVLIAVVFVLTALSRREDAPDIEVVQMPERETVPVISVELVRTENVTELGVDSPSRLAVSPEGATFYLAPADEPTTVVALEPAEPTTSTITLPSALGQDSSYTYDLATDALVVFAGGDTISRAPIDGSGTADFAIPSTEPGVFTDGIAVDRANERVHGLHDNQLTTFALAPGGTAIGRVIRRIDLAPLLTGPARGLAVGPSGRTYVADPTARSVLQLNPGGDPSQILDLSAAGAGSVLDLAVSASADTSDAVTVSSLYVLDAPPDGTGPGPVVRELTTTAPRADAIAGTRDRATLRQVIPLGGLSPPTPDASGVTWVAGRGRLLVADSEVDEYDYSDGTNLRELTTAGELTGAPSTLAWSNEPSGITADPAGNRIFTSDDDRTQVYEVDRGPDQVPGTSDDTVLQSFDTSAFGSTDPEGIAYDARRGWLHVADGANKEVFSIDPGENGVFEGASGDDVITQFDTGAAGIRDPEGIVHDDRDDTLIVVDHARPLAVEFGLRGSVLRYIDLSDGGDGLRPAGVTFAPASTEDDRSLWVVERGADGPEPRDGALYEFGVPPLGNGSPAPIIGAPAAAVFDPVGVGLVGRREVDIINEGTSPLEVTSLRIAGPDASQFTLPDDPGTLVVPGGDSVSVAVEFSPTEIREHSATFSVSSNALGRPSVVVALEGSGVLARARLSIQSQTIRYPRTAVGATSRREVIISNPGTAPLELTSIDLSGPGSSRFDLALESPELEIAPGRSEAIPVDFSPTDLASSTARLAISSNDEDRRSVAITLVGESRSRESGVIAESSADGESFQSVAVTTDQSLEVDESALYLAYVSSKPALPVRAVSGMGGAWSPVGSQCAGRGQTSVAVFATTDAREASAVTATMEDRAVSAAIAVVSYSGAALDGPIGTVLGYNSNGAGGGCSGGTDSSAHTASVPTSATRSLVTGVATMRNRTHTPGPGITPLVEVSAGSGGDVSSLSVVARRNEDGTSVPMSGKFSSDTDWAFVAVEIRAAG